MESDAMKEVKISERYLNDEISSINRVPCFDLEVNDFSKV